MHLAGMIGIVEEAEPRCRREVYMHTINVNMYMY